VRVTTQKPIEILYPTEIAANGHILHCALVQERVFSLIPWTAVLFPGDSPLWGCQINIHVCPSKIFDHFIHVFTFLKELRYNLGVLS
jgi:hypothetical protein